MEPRNVARRVERLEGIVLALVGKVRKMAGHEESFRTLQGGVTQAGGDLKRSFEAVVQAHDSGDAGKFDEAVQEHLDFINSLQNMGTSGNTATRAGQSPSGTGGASTGDLPQGRNQNHVNAKSQAGAQDDGERDVVVKGRDMPD